MLIVLLTLLAFGGPSPILVDTGDAANLSGALLVDARSAEDFARGHIPGAAHLDVESLSEVRGSITGMLKSPDELRTLFAAAGLDPSRTIVVYSGLEETSDVKRATRLFWALEYLGYPDVRLLDGGLAKWKAEDRPLEAGPGSVAAVEVVALAALDPDEAQYATREDVEAARSGGKAIIADLRGESLFSGAEKKSFVERGGHIPGAVNQPAPDFLEAPFNTFKSPEAIRELLGATQDDKTAVVTYCNTGRDATVGYVAYRIAGFDTVAVYDGSMAEWGNRADCPVATEKE